MTAILLIGSGAREHALARALLRAEPKPALYCFANSYNPGIAELAQGYQRGDLSDITAILAFAQAQAQPIDFAVIGPEAPLALGLADQLWAQSIPVIGPKQQLAQIETSKQFTRNLLQKYNIPGNPAYRYFTELSGAADYMESLDYQCVIKADGLMGGKGVKVMGDQLNSAQEALGYCEQLLAQEVPFVIEQKGIGPEFSLISFSDGHDLVHMPLVQDHKRAYVGDTGPNTGGMGSISFADHGLPFVSAEHLAQAKAINHQTIKALAQETGERYIGFLYGGYMVTAQGVMLIEFNARLGDPEAINLLALLESDLVSHCQAMIAGRLAQESVRFAQKYTVCKYAVPEGYPDHPVKQQVIDLSALNTEQRAAIYLAAVDQQADQQLVETGSRTLASLGIANTMAEAEQQAQQLIEQINGPLFHRADIGTEALIKQRMALLTL